MPQSVDACIESVERWIVMHTGRLKHTCPRIGAMRDNANATAGSGNQPGSLPPPEPSVPPVQGHPPGYGIPPGIPPTAGNPQNSALPSDAVGDINALNAKGNTGRLGSQGKPSKKHDQGGKGGQPRAPQLCASPCNIRKGYRPDVKSRSSFF